MIVQVLCYGVLLFLGHRDALDNLLPPPEQEVERYITQYGVTGLAAGQRSL